MSKRHFNVTIHGYGGENEDGGDTTGKAFEVELYDYS